MAQPVNHPAVFRALQGKIPDEAVHAIRLLFDGLKDNSDAITALKGQHDTVATQVTAVSTVATAAQATANQTATTQAQPVPAGQVNQQTLNYTTQQTDHLGSVVLTGTGTLTVSLNPLVNAPWRTKIMNQTSHNATLSPITGAVNGPTTLASNASADVFWDGFTWWVG